MSTWIIQLLRKEPLQTTFETETKNQLRQWETKCHWKTTRAVLISKGLCTSMASLFFCYWNVSFPTFSYLPPDFKRHVVNIRCLLFPVFRALSIWRQWPTACRQAVGPDCITLCSTFCSAPSLFGATTDVVAAYDRSKFSRLSTRRMLQARKLFLRRKTCVHVRKSQTQ